ncbi:DNA ligase D [Paenibacillus chungangensis]|uniref:DNA ligase (ATP) n=1 Tax=Paenibacillus chungangensis TaxID=696535 RepID=A0ABW3HRD8_9BACL
MTKKLGEYNQKRNFHKTLEPEGKLAASEEGLKFVVQHHMARREHYDLRLEWEGVLLSWAVPKGPSYNPHDRRLAVMVEDHPLDYRNFEGTIPKGQYGGGVVMLWDEGIWEPYGDVEKGLLKGELKFVLRGKRLRGKWVLIRWQAKSGDEKDNWLLMKERDEYVQTDDGISGFRTSIRTGRTMVEIEVGEEEKFARNPFSKVEAQLAKSVQAIPRGDDWLYEMKYDGYRMIAFVEGNDVRLLTRNGNDYAKRFYDIASALVDLAAGRAMVLDGEVAITDESGKTDFQALQNYFKNPKARNLTYIVFDLLALDGEDLRGKPLTDRKERLEALLQNAPGNLYYSRHIRGRGKESFAAACEASMEGIIGKKADSAYSGTRTGDWIKLKCDRRQEFVIGGYALSDKKTNGISSLLLGVYEDGELVYAGRVGTGIGEADRKLLEKKFEKLKRKTPPFKVAPKSRPKEKLTWLEPEVVAEIKFAEWTKEHQLRQASFKGLRTDKKASEVKKEVEVEIIQPESPAAEEERKVVAISNSIVIEGIPITNPDKVLFVDPDITKEDVIRYYAKVAGHMLPYASRRILTLVRCPKGISQTCFYKKHPGPDNKGIVTIPITTGSGKREDYFYIENSSGFIAEAQMGTLEFHIWGSRIDELEKPDMMVFDLDPDEGMDLDRVRQGARDMKSVLDELSLRTYLKTSGGKGYHVVVPFQPAMSWDQFHDFARRVAGVMEQKWPDRYTSNVRKANRAGKIFIDWIRNGRGATSIAPYSIRARKGGKVSMPISWDELDTVAPDGISMADALLRIGGSADPWQDFFRDR